MTEFEQHKGASRRAMLRVRSPDRRKAAYEVIARLLHEFYERLKAESTTTPEEFLQRLQLSDDEVEALKSDA